MSEPAETSLLNGKQLAARLGVSAGQITLWHQAGVIPAEIKEGRCIRFDLDHVREHLAKRAAKKGARR
jgi:predicted site-specific integrase-resolvase